jgi:hypothetical protein
MPRMRVRVVVAMGGGGLVRGGDVVEVSRHLLLERGQLVLAFVVFFFLVFAGEGGVGAAVAGAVAAFVGASVSILR